MLVMTVWTVKGGRQGEREARAPRTTRAVTRPALGRGPLTTRQARSSKLPCGSIPVVTQPPRRWGRFQDQVVGTARRAAGEWVRHVILRGLSAAMLPGYPMGG